MATAARQSDYKSEVRDAARRLWTAYNDLQALQAEWQAQDYATTLPTDPDGANSGITAGAFGAVVFDTADAIKTLMDNGHATNLTNIL